MVFSFKFCASNDNENIARCMRGKSLAAKAHIVSFDEARAASRTRDAKRDSSSYSGNRRDSRSRAASGAQRYERPAYEDTGYLRMPASRRDGRAYAWSDDGEERLRSSAFAYEDEWAEPLPEPVDEDPSRAVDKRERRRRERSKARANRMFSKQYESESSSSASEEGAPRPALYEGKMGSSHRKSARMQRASSAVPQTAKINPAGWFSNVNISPRLLRIGTAVLCLVLVGVFLYTPAQQYYQAQREHDKLAAEYASLEQRNEALGSQNTALSSNAGMEDAVREKYGYVVQGDETAVVTGLSETTTDASRDGAGIEANVLSSTVKAPEEWYTPYLDAFFGVS